MELQPIINKPIIVNKGWGHEQWIVNNEEYCGKKLVFKEGAKFSMHFHKDKREHFYVDKGSIRLITINPETAQKLSTVLKVGQVVEIPRLLPHQIEALEDSEILEFSTHHEDSDSYRVEPGNSQGVK